MTMMEVESRLTALEAEVAMLKLQLEDADLAAAVNEGMAQLERGEGVPAIQAIRELGRKYGLERP
jgi:predicted transcriptional regulator